MEQVMQAPNGKFYFKKYNENGDSIFTSEIIYKSEVEANKAMKEHVYFSKSGVIDVDIQKEPKIEKQKPVTEDEAVAPKKKAVKKAK